MPVIKETVESKRNRESTAKSTEFGTLTMVQQILDLQ